MPLFIVLSLALSFLVQTASPLQTLFVTTVVIYSSLGVAFISIVGSLFRKLPSIIWYDIFSSSTLLVWFCMLEAVV